MSGVGNRIRQYRVQRGMTQSELALQVGKNRSAIGNYEGGTREPDYDTLAKLARALEVSIMDLLRDSVEYDPAEDDEVWKLREEYRRDPDRRILFSLAENGSAQDVRQAVALIDALKKTNPNYYDGDDPS